MVIVTESAPEPAEQPAEQRPWPAPGPDAGWWETETVAPSAVPAVPRRRDGSEGTDLVVAGTVPRPGPGRRRRGSDRSPVAELGAPEPAPAPEAALEPAPAPEPVTPPVAQPVAQPGAQAAPAPKPVPPDDAFPLWPSMDIPWPSGRVTRVRKPKVARRTKGYRRPGVGLPALVLLALLAGFLAWVSADAFWIAMGHGRTGTATVTRCAGGGLDSRCTGTFTARGFTARRVALAGLPREARRQGATAAATMASARGRVAYARRVHDPRWAIGFGLALLCGLAIAWATGAGRLPRRGARLGAFAASLAGPLLLLAGALAVTW